MGYRQGIEFQHPCWEPWGAGHNDSVCVESEVPEAGLSCEVFVWGPLGAPVVDSMVLPARGRECRTDSLSLDLADSVRYWTLRGWAVDRGRNRTVCPAELTFLGAPPVTGVPLTRTMTGGPAGLFDVQGREVSGLPLASGIYFRRVPGQKARRVVVLK